MVPPLVRGCPVAVAVDIPDDGRLICQHADADHGVRMPRAKPALERHRVIRRTAVELLPRERDERRVSSWIENEDRAQGSTSGHTECQPPNIAAAYQHERDSSEARNTFSGRRLLLASVVAEPPLEDGGPTLTWGKLRTHRDGEPTAEPVSSPRRPTGSV